MIKKYSYATTKLYLSWHLLPTEISERLLGGVYTIQDMISLAFYASQIGGN